MKPDGRSSEGWPGRVSAPTLAICEGHLTEGEYTCLLHSLKALEFRPGRRCWREPPSRLGRPPLSDWSTPMQAPAIRTEPAVLDLHVGELRQLFNSMDPAPFRKRDLDPKAQAYIVEWAQEVPAGRPLELVVHVDAETVTAAQAAMLKEAIDEYFRQRALATWRGLRKMFRVGRISLLIGVLFVAGATVVGESIANFVSGERSAALIHDSLVIGGWVALWRPMEIFLYDWWPVRTEGRLYERLSRLEVRLICADGKRASA